MLRPLRLALAGLGLLLSADSLAVGERPNIVIFLADDLGRLETSVYGSKEVRTPNMEALARNGMTFNNAYVASPSCCPNRFSLLTGLMPARHGAHPNHSQVKEGTKFLLPRLQKLGYHVASFGKVGHGRAKIAGCDSNFPRPREMSKNVVAWFNKTGRTLEKPICLLVGDRRPHVPWVKESIYDPAEVTLPSYFIDTPETRQHWARYLTDITGMDRELGRVLHLARERLGKNTIVLFTSDHGGQWHRAKWTLYDAGTRVPLIVSWPGHIEKSVRSDGMVSWVDILPTLLELVGSKSPEGIDGRSFASVLRGNSTNHRDRIFTTHTGDAALNIFPIRSVRIGNTKYIHNLRPEAWFTNHSDRFRKDGAGAFWDSWEAAAKKDPKAAAVLDAYYTRPEDELFDLQADPLELNNLAKSADHQKLLAELKAALKTWTTAQGDDLKPHRDPYLRSKPIPTIKPPVRKPRRPKP